MIEILIKDINGKELTMNSKIRLCNEDEESYGEISSVKLNITDDSTYEISAFEKNHTYTRISNGQFSPLFLIVD